MASLVYEAISWTSQIGDGKWGLEPHPREQSAPQSVDAVELVQRVQQGLFLPPPGQERLRMSTLRRGITATAATAQGSARPHQHLLGEGAAGQCAGAACQGGGGWRQSTGGLARSHFPVLQPAPAPPPKSALQQLQQATTQAMQAKRKLDKAIEWAAKLRVKLKDAEEAAVKLYVEAQVADEAHAAAREAHARTCALPAQQLQPPAPTPTASQVLGCDFQGLEQDDDIKAALAQFQLLQQAFVQQVQAKRAAATPAPTPVPPASPLGDNLTPSGPSDAPPDNVASEDHEMGEADTGKRKDADREEDEDAQRVKHARMQLLADVKSAGDEQRKQLGATSGE